jgi:hypothetical protein
MRIKFVLINEENLLTIKEKSASLVKSMVQGETSKSDLITEELFFLTRDMPTVFLDEKKWRLLLLEIRKEYCNYRADFIIEEEDLYKLSEIRLDCSYKDLLELVQMAIVQKRRILQIPYEEEDRNV